MKTLKACGAFCGVLAGMFAWNSLCVFPENTSAADGHSVEINVTVENVLAIAIDDQELALNLTPSVVGTTGSVSTGVEVSTNNRTGYTLTIATNSEESALVSDGATTKIAGVEVAAELSNIANNTWGYLGSDDLYHAVPSSNEAAAVLRKTTSITDDGSSTLQFGVKIDNGMATGDYGNTVVLTAVANQ